MGSKAGKGAGDASRDSSRSTLEFLAVSVLLAAIGLLATGCDPKRGDSSDDRNKPGIIVTPPTAVSNQTCLDSGLRNGWHPGVQDQYGQSSLPYNWSANAPSSSLGFCGCPTGYQATCFPGQGLACLPVQPIDSWWYDLYSWDWNQSDFRRSQYFGAQGFWYFTIWYWGGVYWEFSSYDTGWQPIDRIWYPEGVYGDEYRDDYSTWSRDGGRQARGPRAQRSIWQRSRPPVTQSFRAADSRRPGMSVRVQAPWASVPNAPNSQAPAYGPITPTNPGYSGPQNQTAWWNGATNALQCQAAVAHGCDSRIANACGVNSICRPTSGTSPFGICVSATRNRF